MEKTDSLKDEHKGIPLNEWIPLPDKKQDEVAWTKIVLYHTGNNYAVATQDGIGELQEDGVPRVFDTNPDREYRSKEEDIITYLENEIDERGLKMTS